MALLQLRTMGLVAMMALSVSLAEDSVLPVVEAEQRGPVEIVKKESHPVLFRQKREWIWNSLYVVEEQPAPIAYKIGQLKSSQRAEVKKFKIDGEGANTIFTVDHKGDLFVTRILDREEKNAYHLTARMYDGNNKLIEDSGDFVVQVTDINDNTPVFPKTYNGSIMERSTIGTKVVEVRATDADDPTTANGELRYSLAQDQDLSILSGMISCKTNTLDRETKSQYVVVVKAQDMRGMATGSTSTTSVTITITDTNDNIASFTRNTYELHVPEDHKLNEKIGTLELEDRDQIQNKEPIFNILNGNSKVFNIELSPNKDGNLMLKQALDYETTNSYTFTVQVRENLRNLHFPADNDGSAVTTAKVNIKVQDVDEAPVFSQPIYTFNVTEERIVSNIGTVIARDPDRANKRIRYSILDKDCPISINPLTGQLSTLRMLDRELEPTHMFQVKAQEEPSGLESFVKVNIIVKDINDNKPELTVDEIFVCENDLTNMVRKRRYLHLDDPKDYSMDVRISDGGRPIQTSITKLAIKVCVCDARRIPTQCKAGARRMGVSVHALIAILLCILTILVIVILFVMRKRYQKDSLASMKNSGEIHEQLVTYDEEGGGEMDTNGYDVSILTSKPPHHTQPTACKGDMAVMIEVKKDEADHDRDGFPYDTLHIYGYEGPESLAGSLSSLQSSSTGSNLDYDFLNDWGPRFRTLAELYGVDAPDYYHQY
uniref:Cadherin-5 n=1 Tax=Sander lucioperca TaxID=283035 RepID=A0A8C9ZA30_SANLU